MFRSLVLFTVLVVAVAASTPHHHHHADTSSLPATLSINLALHHRNWDVFQSHFDRITDINDDMYGKWMSIEELAEMTGVTKQQEKSLRHMLRDLGATNIHLSASRSFMSCDIPTAVAMHLIDDLQHAHKQYHAVSSLHHNAMLLIQHVWRRPIHTHDPLKKHRHTKKSHYVGMDKYQAKLDVMNDLMSQGQHKMVHTLLRDDPTSGTPANQWQAYGVPTGTFGSNPNNSQLVWGPGTYGYLATDLSSYYSTFGISANEKQYVVDNGPYKPAYPGVPGGDNFGEGTLDVTLISGLAPGIMTVVSNTDNSTSAEEGYGFGPALLNFVTYLASNPTIPNVISMSLGSLSWDSCNILCTQVASAGITYQQCSDYMQQQRQVCMYPDSNGVDLINNEFQKLGARGITLLAATGDGGSHFSFQRFSTFDPIGIALNTVSCNLNFPTFPAGSPWVLGVGGTDWSQGGYQQAQPWVASGSGFDWRYPAPKYQQQAVVNYLKNNAAALPPNGAFNASNRAYPDVAALATNVPIYMQGFLTASGGTSASTPAFAAIISLINDARMNKGLPSLGFVNPRLYDIASKYYNETFVDYNTGSSACDSAGFCCSTGFPAATGWDPTTGLGSPLYPGLLKYLGSD